MKNKSIIFLLIIASTSLFSQNDVNYNQELVNLVSAKKYFEAESFYSKNQYKITDDFTQLFYKASMFEAFNQIDSAVFYNQEILKKYKNVFGAQSYLNLLLRFEQYCVDEHLFDLAYKLNEEAIDYYRNDTTLGDSVFRAGRVKHHEEFRVILENVDFIANQNKLTNMNPDNEERIDLIVKESNGGILVNNTWNGIKLRTIFDTGAGASGYIWNRDIAEKIGVKMNYTDTILLNGTTIKVLSGIVDSLHFGKFKVENIPVYVSIDEIDKNDLKQVLCDSMLNSMFDIVLGLPIIREFGVVVLDFENNTMSFPKSFTHNANAKRNMYINNQVLYLNVSIWDSEYTLQFDTGGFIELIMNSYFYLVNENKIEIEELEDEEKNSFTGGCNAESFSENKYYRWTNAEYSINGTLIKKEKSNCTISLERENDYIYGTEGGGAIGNIMFKDSKKAVFDFNNMIFSIYR